MNLEERDTVANGIYVASADQYLNQSINNINVVFDRLAIYRQSIRDASLGAPQAGVIEHQTTAAEAPGPDVGE